MALNSCTRKRGLNPDADGIPDAAPPLRLRGASASCHDESRRRVSGTGIYMKNKETMSIQRRQKMVNRCIKKIWCIHKLDYYSALRTNEILPFAASWMELESIMLREVNQRKTKDHMTSRTCGI